MSAIKFSSWFIDSEDERVTYAKRDGRRHSCRRPATEHPELAIMALTAFLRDEPVPPGFEIKTSEDPTSNAPENRLDCGNLTCPTCNPATTIPLTGQMVRAGTFVASGEEVTGVVIAIDPGVLAAQRHLPMYRRVVVMQLPL